MPEANHRFEYLLKKYVADELIGDELQEFHMLINSGYYEEDLKRLIASDVESELAKSDPLTRSHSSFIIDNILASEKHISQTIRKPKNKIDKKVLLLAAAIVAIMLVTSLLLLTDTPEKVEKLSHTPPPAELKPAKVAGLLSTTNNTNQPFELILEDNSKVILDPGTSIQYAAKFSKDTREVFLTGDAFFDIQKNPDRPFLVYSKNIITKVLGTSFRIKTDPKFQQLEVSVKSGKVQVYENEKDSAVYSYKKTTYAGVKQNAVILLPNQKVIYKELSRQFIYSIADNPQPLVGEHIAAPALAKELIFEEASVAEVFEKLHQLFGIDIIADTENILQCHFTGDISSQPFKQKLDIICNTLNASFEMIGTQIVVHGKGCD